jgi:hypothetical protein
LFELKARLGRGRLFGFFLFAPHRRYKRSIAQKPRSLGGGGDLLKGEKARLKEAELASGSRAVLVVHHEPAYLDEAFLDAHETIPFEGTTEETLQAPFISDPLTPGKREIAVDRAFEILDFGKLEWSVEIYVVAFGHPFGVTVVERHFRKARPYASFVLGFRGTVFLKRLEDRLSATGIGRLQGFPIKQAFHFFLERLLSFGRERSFSLGFQGPLIKRCLEAIHRFLDSNVCFRLF